MVWIQSVGSCVTCLDAATASRVTTKPDAHVVPLAMPLGFLQSWETCSGSDNKYARHYTSKLFTALPTHAFIYTTRRLSAVTGRWSVCSLVRLVSWVFSLFLSVCFPPRVLCRPVVGIPTAVLLSASHMFHWCRSLIVQWLHHHHHARALFVQSCTIYCCSALCQYIRLVHHSER